MAYYFTTIGTAAGSRLVIWDDFVLLNAKWTLHDGSAGTNAKVYKHYDAAENILEYWLIKDNQASYSTIEIWEGWDEVGHAGTGYSVVSYTTYTYRVYAYAGVHIIVNDRRVIICGSPNAYGYYLGQLKRIDTSKNMPLIIAQNSYSTQTSNPLGTYYDLTNGSFWRALFNHLGLADQALNPVGAAGTFAYNQRKTSLGTWILNETPVYDNATTVVLGWLDGVCDFGISAMLPAQGETIWTDQGGWLVMRGGSGACAVRLT